MQDFNIGASSIFDIKAHNKKLMEIFKKSVSPCAVEISHTLHQALIDNLNKVLYEAPENHDEEGEESEPNFLGRKQGLAFFLL